MRLIEEIDRNKYVPQRSQVVFRDGYDPSTLLMRLAATCLFLAGVYFTPASSPCETMDR